MDARKYFFFNAVEMQLMEMEERERKRMERKVRATKVV